jgi:dienelactone hydrolase
MSKEQLTNEALKKHFHDNFELARFAINVARYLIKAGHEVDVPDLLKEIQKNPGMYTPENLEMLAKAEKEQPEEQPPIPKNE